MVSHNKISFVVEVRDEGLTHEVRPVIDDCELVELVGKFEACNGYSPNGSYGGLIPEFFNYGKLDKYLLGQTGDDGHWSNLGGIYILGCECGEVGCWPLICKVYVEGDNVIWDRFSQPHRPEWQYQGFGPFRFSLSEYQTQVAKVVGSLGNDLQH